LRRRGGETETGFLVTAVVTRHGSKNLVRREPVQYLPVGWTLLFAGFYYRAQKIRKFTEAIRDAQSP